IQLPDCMKGRYENDPIFGPIVKDPSAFKHYLYEGDLLYLKDDGRLLLCIPDIKVGNRNLREIIISHAHSILAHLG
ncbi:hypothetical protein CPB86DRAFT_670524, partial [Serendipita vermifera]